MTDLLELALADPAQAWTRAEAVVAESTDPLELSGRPPGARGSCCVTRANATRRWRSCARLFATQARVDPER